MIQNPHHDDLLFELGVLPECWRDQDALLAVAGAFKGATDKDAPEPSHTVAFFGQGKDPGFDVAPLIQRVGNEAAVHAGHHDRSGATGFDGIPEPGRNDNATLRVNCMETASSEHKSPFNSTLIHYNGVKVQNTINVKKKSLICLIVFLIILFT